MNNTLSSNLERIKTATDDLREIVGMTSNDTIEEVVSEVQNKLPSNLEEKDVNFYDYDGTLLYSYTKEECLELEELPSNPSHDGLVAQGWNWSLVDIKQYIQTMPNGLEIGQNYTTDDGSSRFYIDLENYHLDLYARFAINGSLKIDWGDGSELQDVSGSSVSNLVSIHHIYPAPGKYVLRLCNVSGTLKIMQTGGLGFYLIGPETIDTTNRYLYKQCLYKVELGDNIRIDQHAFTSSFVETVSVSIGSLEAAAGFEFYCCNKLKCLVVPAGVPYVARGTVAGCHNLKVFSIPNNISTINSDVRQGTDVKNYYYPLSITALYLDDLASVNSGTRPNCRYPGTVYVPKNVTNVTGNSYYGTHYLQVSRLDFTRHQSIPSLSVTFYGNGYKILVPSTLYENWCLANKWSNTASSLVPYDIDIEVPHSRITLAVDSNLSGTTINVAKTIYKLNTSGYTLPSYSNITSTTPESDLEWFDGTNTYGFGDTIILNGNITLTLRSKE